MKFLNEFSIRKNIALLLGRTPNRGPDFFIAGATRAGTTYLHHLLGKHPDIFMPRTKELHYFNHAGKYREDLKNYFKMFYGYNEEKCIGEATPLYLEKGTLYNAKGGIEFFQEETTIARLHHHYPHAKIIVSLRDPMARIESLYAKNFSQGKIKTTLQEEITNELQGNSRLNLLFRNRYDLHLEELFKYYPREQIKIFLFEEWTNNITETCYELCSFLGVPYQNIEGSEDTKNTRQSYQIRNPSNEVSSPHFVDDALKTIVKDQLLSVRSYVEEALGKKVSWEI